MGRSLMLTGAIICLLPMAAIAAPKHAMTTHKTPVAAKKHVTAATYECVKCHMKYSAAVAKKNHYVDPMDGGKLIPVHAATGAKKPMSGMKM